MGSCTVRVTLDRCESIGRWSHDILINIDGHDDASGAADAEVPDEAAEAQRLYASGLTVKEVAEAMAIPPGRARRFLSTMQLRKGVPRPRSNVPDALVLELREVHRFTWEQLGIEIGMTTQGARTRYLAAVARRGDPSEAATRAAVELVEQRVRLRDQAQARLVRSVQKAHNLGAAHAELAEILGVPEEVVQRMIDRQV